MLKEIYVDIQGFIGLYKISNFGNVKSFRRKEPIILSPFKDTNGYHRVSLCGKDYSVHRLVANAFLPKIENKDLTLISLQNIKTQLEESELEEKWDDDAKIKKTGEYAGKTLEQLQKELASLKEKSKKYQDKDEDVPQDIIRKEAQVKFAIRAKRNWPKGHMEEKKIEERRKRISMAIGMINSGKVRHD